MSSLDIVKGRKGMDASGLAVIIGAIILLIIAGILIYNNVTSVSKAGKQSCTSYGYGKGYCIENKEKCSGVINTLAKCTAKAPYCCIEKGSAVPQTAGSGTGGETAPAADTQDDAAEEQETQLKGSNELYCTCKDVNGYLTPPSLFNSVGNLLFGLNKMSIKDIKTGKVDFKSKVNAEFGMQARGTEDIKYCKISSPGIGDAATDCDSAKGPALKVKFIKEGDYDITLQGYDKKDGTLVKSAVVDVKVEK